MINRNFYLFSSREHLSISLDGPAEELTKIESDLTEFNKKIADIYCQLVENRIIKNYHDNFCDSESELEPTPSEINLNINQELFQSQLFFEPQFNEAKKLVKLALSEAKIIFLCGSIYDSDSAIKIIPREIILTILQSDIEMTMSLDTCHKIASLRAQIEGKNLQKEALRQLQEESEVTQDTRSTQKDKRIGRPCIVS